MNTIKKHKYDIYLFIIEAICMILELCASRTLSPYFGDSNIVWTSIIGIILLSASLGNTLGGKMADRTDIAKVLPKITLIAAALIFCIPVFADIALSIIVACVQDAKAGAIIGTVCLFLPSSLMFGTVPPIITKLKLENMDDVGKTSGSIHAVSTLGGIFGTFLGGFFLVPTFGCDNILLLLALITATAALLVGDKKMMLAVSFVISITVACFSVFSSYNQESNDAVLKGEIGFNASYDTQYSQVNIVNEMEDGELIRRMIVGNGCESATYLSEDKKYELPILYTRYYDLMFCAQTQPQSTLMIGGAGYSYPKYLVSHYDDVSIDVVEIDAKITELAKEYFFLDDALTEFNTDGNTRLNLITADGKVFLNTSENKYDAILNDAFSGVTPVETLTTRETVTQIHDMLNPGGVYLTNIIGSLRGDNSKFLHAEANTISQVFDYVYVVPCHEDNNIDEYSVRNNMVIASDVPLNIPEAADLDFSNGVILTDDYCPVDSLIPTPR